MTKEQKLIKLFEQKYEEYYETAIRYGYTDRYADKLLTAVWTLEEVLTNIFGYPEEAIEETKTQIRHKLWKEMSTEDEENDK